MNCVEKVVEVVDNSTCRSSRICFVVTYLRFAKNVHCCYTSRIMANRRDHEETDKQTRIAIVSDDKCKPKRCRQECKKSCPVVRMGKLCIEVAPSSKIASLSEELCIGCGICVKVGEQY